MQLDFIKRVWDGLDEDHKRLQYQTLQILNSKLTIVTSKLDSLRKSGTGHRRKANYALIKEKLDKSIEDLVSWQKTYDPSWYLILKISNSCVDQELSRAGSAVSSFPGASGLRNALSDAPPQKINIFLPKEELDTAQIYGIPFSSAKCMQRVDSDKWFLIDRVPFDSSFDINIITGDIRNLARKLQSVDALTFGVLQCRGVVRMTTRIGDKNPSSFDFIFKIPKGLSHEPRSLRNYLCAADNTSLTQRFEVAKQMAKSVSYIHMLGFVHKNIRPETLLGFQRKDKSGHDMFFLVGFENVRTAEGRTLRSGDSLWEKNLYRHPSRQGLNPEDAYTMQHDIYSLGICLLEIGLWHSFLSYRDDASDPIPSPKLSMSLDGQECEQPTLVKEHLMDLAHQHLPDRMGDRYEKLVLNCLTCLDDDNTDFGDQSEFEDADGVLVGVRYIEKVSLRLLL